MFSAIKFHVYEEQFCFSNISSHSSNKAVGVRETLISKICNILGMPYCKKSKQPPFKRAFLSHQVALLKNIKFQQIQDFLLFHSLIYSMLKKRKHVGIFPKPTQSDNTAPSFSVQYLVYYVEFWGSTLTLLEIWIFDFSRLI